MFFAIYCIQKFCKVAIVQLIIIDYFMWNIDEGIL